MTWRTDKIFLSKGKFTIPSLLNAPKARLCSSNKTNFFYENLSNNSSLDDSDIYLPVFPCGNNRKLYIIPITPTLVKKVIINFDSSEVPGLDCIPVVVFQKNCESELSYILA